MPKDERLYMTFPNDFWMHPKIAPLSTEAKWTFVEMNGYSRMQDLDGRIPAAMATRLWSGEVLAELVGSHPERPIVVLEEGVYVIRDYARHQQTTADRDALSAVRSEAGRRGRAQQLQATGANVGQVPGQIRAETELETEIETKKAKEKASSRFAEFWSVYPRKHDKRTAESAFERAVKRATADAIIAGARQYAGDPNREASFTKHPATWLNADAWANGPLPAQGGPSKDDRFMATVEIGRRLQAQSAQKELA